MVARQIAGLPGASVTELLIVYSMVDWNFKPQFIVNFKQGVKCSLF